MEIHVHAKAEWFCYEYTCTHVGKAEVIFIYVVNTHADVYTVACNTAQVIGYWN